MATRGWPTATSARTEQASTRAICRLLALKFRPRREEILATGACTKRDGGGGAGNTSSQAGAGNTSPQAGAGNANSQAGAGNTSPQAEAGNTSPQAGAGNTSLQAGLKKEPKKAKCMLGGRSQLRWLFH